MTERGGVVRKYAWERCDQVLRPVAAVASARTNRRKRTGRGAAWPGCPGSGAAVSVESGPYGHR